MMTKRIAVVFPGQGAQVACMGKVLYEQQQEARDLFGAASRALGFDMAELCFYGDPPTLTKTSNAQPAILMVSYASYRVHMGRYRLSPKFLAGHSLGEYTALVAADALGFEDALRIVRRRGELMEQSDPEGAGTMAAVRGLPSKVVTEACQRLGSDSQVLVVANFNSPTQTVISGHHDIVQEAARVLGQNGADVVFLEVAGAFHSPLMAPAAEELAEIIRSCPMEPPRLPVLSNVDARPHGSVDEIRARLVEQMTHPVKWAETMDYLEQQEVDIVLDTGPKAILRNLAGQNSLLMAAFSLDKEEDQSDLEKRLFGAYLHFIKRALGIAVSEKNRNDDQEEYDRGVVHPYREVQATYRAVMEEGRLPRSEDARAAMAMVLSVLRTKLVPESIQKERIDQILGETGLEGFFQQEASQ